jgi:hypothetical protein
MAATARSAASGQHILACPAFPAGTDRARLTNTAHVSSDIYLDEVKIAPLSFMPARSPGPSGAEAACIQTEVAINPAGKSLRLIGSNSRMLM